MRLDRGTRSILAYFRDKDAALQAAQTMTEHGFKDVSVDTIVAVPGRAVYSSPATSLTSMVLGMGSGRGGHQQVLLGADPDVSGMSASQGGGLGGYTHMITMTADSSQADTAVQLLKSYGALV